jgi:hypothetical protein
VTLIGAGEWDCKSLAQGSKLKLVEIRSFIQCCVREGVALDGSTKIPLRFRLLSLSFAAVVVVVLVTLTAIDTTNTLDVGTSGTPLGASVVTAPDLSGISSGLAETTHNPSTLTSKIDEAVTPLAAGFSTGANWAALNLICLLISLVWSLVLLATFFVGSRGRRDTSSDEDDAGPVRDFSGDAWLLTERPAEYFAGGKRFNSRIIGIVVGGIALAAFALTEDMTLSMTWIDSWSPLMVLLLLVQDFITLHMVIRKDTDTLTSAQAKR